MSIKIKDALEVVPTDVSDEVRTFNDVVAAWKEWDRRVNWAERVTCLSQLTAALDQLEILHPLLRHQKTAEVEAAKKLERERLDAEEQRKKQAVLEKVDQPQVGKQLPSSSNGKVENQTLGISVETQDVETVTTEEPHGKKPEPDNKPKLTAADKRKLSKQKAKQKLDQEARLKQDANNLAKVEATKIQTDHAARLQKVLSDGEARELKLKLHGLRVVERQRPCQTSTTVAVDMPPPAHRRGDADAATAAAQLVDERREDAGAAARHRVTETDRAAVDVDDGVVEPEDAAARDRHRRERLVDLDQVDIGDVEPGPFERPGDRDRRRDAGLARRDAGVGPRADRGERRPGRWAAA